MKICLPAIAAGADFPRMLVDLSLGRHVRPSIGQFRNQVWMTSYESSVFLEGERVTSSGRRRVIPLENVA